MIKEEPSTSSSDAKIDSLARAMERMMDRLTITEKNPPRENNLLHKFGILTSEEILLKSGREILGIKENRGVLINRSYHPYRKIMSMKEKK